MRANQSQQELPFRIFPRSTIINLVTLTAAIGTVWAVFGAYRAFYFQGPFLEAIAYSTDERPTAQIYSSVLQRDPSELLVGIHVFFDFLNPYYWGTLANPWQDTVFDFPVNYPPLVLSAMKFFAMFDYHTALLIYLPLMVIALVAPIWIGMAGFPLPLKVLAVVVLALLTGPAIASIDRGNTQGFLPILLFAFGVAALRGRWNWAAVFIVMATSLKLFPIVLVLLLLAERKWRQALWASVAVVAIQSAGFLLFPPPYVDTFRIWLSKAFDFITERSFADFMIYNASFAGGVTHWVDVAGARGMAQTLAAHSAVLIVIGVGLVAPLIFMRGAVPLPMRIMAALMLTTTVMPVSYPYGLNWAIAAAGVIVYATRRTAAEPRVDLSNAMSFRVQRFSTITSLALLLAFYPVFIPGTAEERMFAGLASLATPMAVVVFALGMWGSIAIPRVSIPQTTSEPRPSLAPV